MRQHIAALILSILATACASGGITPRAREVEALRGEVELLKTRAKSLEGRLAAAHEEQLTTLETRESALRAELLQLQGQVVVLRAAIEEGSPDAEGPSLTDAGEPRTNGPARVRNTRRKADEQEEADDQEPEPPPTDGERVRALMADVASRLQVASETVADDKSASARLGRARQLLVDADRAASKKDFAQAEELAQDAAEVIADAVAKAGTAQR